MASLEAAPPEVFPSGGAPPSIVHLLEAVLPDIADVEVTVLSVERESPRVSHPVCVDLGSPGPADEGIGARYPVARASGATRIDPQDLAEQGLEVLGAIVWIP